MLWLPAEYRLCVFTLRYEITGKTILTIFQNSGTVFFIELQLCTTNESHGDVDRDPIDDVPAKLVSAGDPHV